MTKALRCGARSWFLFALILPSPLFIRRRSRAGRWFATWMHKLRRCAPYAVAPMPGLSICSDPSFSTFLLPAFLCWTIICHLNAQTEALRLLCCGACSWLPFAPILSSPLLQLHHCVTELANVTHLWLAPLRLGLYLCALWHYVAYAFTSVALELRFNYLFWKVSHTRFFDAFDLWLQDSYT